MPLVETLSRAKVVDLEHRRRFGDPTYPTHQPGTVFTLHRRHEPGLAEARTSASGLIITAEHAGTHIDALCHQAESMKLFGGIPVTSAVQTSAGFTALGIDTVDPIVAPAVLLDVARVRSVREGDLIGADDLRAALDRAGSSIRAGDVVLVRTGFGARWSDTASYLRAPGMAAAASRWLAGQGVKAVGADNVAWDLPGHVDPELGCTLPGHVLLIVRAGVHILENLDLEALATHAPKRFLFICLPLKIAGGTGSPVRPIAVLEDA